MAKEDMASNMNKTAAQWGHGAQFGPYVSRTKTILESRVEPGGIGHLFGEVTIPVEKSLVTG